MSLNEQAVEISLSSLQICAESKSVASYKDGEVAPGATSMTDQAASSTNEDGKWGNGDAEGHNYILNNKEKIIFRLAKTQPAGKPASKTASHVGRLDSIDSMHPTLRKPSSAPCG